MLASAVDWIAALVLASEVTATAGKGLDKGPGSMSRTSLVI
jgi:hypothetical protein